MTKRFWLAAALALSVLFVSISGPTATASTAAAASLQLVRLTPSQVTVGERFNYQAKQHESALSVAYRNAPVGTTIIFAGHALLTARTSQFLAALVPSSLISHPGNYPVYLKYKTQRSNQMTFVVSRGISLLSLSPPEVAVGERFNYQANKRESALAVTARNAPAGTVIVFNGHMLITARTSKYLAALIPASLVSHPGRYPVYLQFRNQRSNQLTFVVRPGISLLSLVPSQVKLGQRFNYQSKQGESALVVTFRNAPVGTVIVFNGHLLPTARAARYLSALIPASMISKRGNYPVYLQYQIIRSNPLTFVVK